jgi:hypothetical protein
VQTGREIAREWKAATGKTYVTVPLPALGFLSGLAKGYNCCPENKLGRITFREWLARRYPKS